MCEGEGSNEAGNKMVLPGWIGNQGDCLEGGRSVVALVWEQQPFLG